MSESLDESVLMAQQEEVDKSFFAKLKEIVMLIKAAVILYQTFKAAWAWKKSKMRMATPAMLLLTYSGIILILGQIYKRTSKQIYPLVILQGLSHYNSFCIMHVLIGFVEASKFVEARK